MASIAKPVANAVVFKTASAFRNQIELIINWTISDFSLLKARETPLFSEVTIVGTSAWSLQLVPLHHHRRGSGKIVDGTDVFVKHDHLGSHAPDVYACFEISIVDGNGKKSDYPAFTHQATFGAPSVFKLEQGVWGSSPLFTHADVWGEDATLNLVDDTLRLRAEIKYLPLGQVTTERIRPEPSPSSKLRAFLAKELCVDFVLITSDGEKRRVDRAALTAHSSYFKAMLESSMKEAKTGRCHLSENSATLDILLNYMFHQSTEGLKNHARDVLVAADKYQIEDLKQECERILLAEVTNQNVAELLLLADRVSASVLKDSALSYVVRDLKAMKLDGQLKRIMDDGDKRLAFEIIAAIAQ